MVFISDQPVFGSDDKELQFYCVRTGFTIRLTSHLVNHCQIDTMENLVLS